MNIQYDNCPVCDESVQWNDSDEFVVCRCCGQKLHIAHDADLVGGVWRNLTTLYIKDDNNQSTTPPTTT